MGGGDIGAYRTLLENVMEQKHLGSTPFRGMDLNRIASHAPALVDQVCSRWHVPREVGQDVIKLALFDIILFIGTILLQSLKSFYSFSLDNSGSMRFEENGERIKDLHLILSRVAYAVTLFDRDGISLRFMNWKPSPYDNVKLDGITHEEEINRLLGTPNQPGQVNFSGLTPLGTELRSQVIEPLILAKARNYDSQTETDDLNKPILVIIITDGQPAGEQRDTLKRTIQYCRDEMRRLPQYSKLDEKRHLPNPVSFQIAQVGNDEPARKFLGELDEDKEIGDIIDCTSSTRDRSACSCA